MTLSKPLLTLTTGLALALLTLSSCSGAATTPVTPVTPPPKPIPAAGEIIATGLNYPQGVLLAPGGTLYIGDFGTAGDTVLGTIPANPPAQPDPIDIKIGNTARILEVAADGTQSVLTTLPSVFLGQEPVGAGKLAFVGGELYTVNGDWSVPDIARPEQVSALLKISAGTVGEVASTWALEKAENPYPGPVDSHPYGLTAGPDGNLWIADAGGNDLLKYDLEAKELSVVSVFAPIPNDNPPAGTPPVSEPVPTAVAFDADGTPYVSLLTGFPFTSGAAKVLQIAADGTFSDYATGLSSLTDLVTGPDGNLYAVSLGDYSFASGAPTPQPGTGSVIRIKPGGVKETVLSGLDTPTAVAFNAKGDAFIVVNGAAAPGTGQVLRYDGLSEYPAKP